MAAKSSDGSSRRRLSTGLAILVVAAVRFTVAQAQPPVHEDQQPCPASPAYAPDACSRRQLDERRDPRLSAPGARLRLPDARVGSFYAPGPIIMGGMPRYAATLLDGAVPGGMVLDRAGRIVGKPTAPGRYEFAVRITDPSNPDQTVIQTFELTVVPAKAP